MLCFFIFFFFSSRRRHTRLTCDWSSDVCSSDLDLGAAGDRSEARVALPRHGEQLHCARRSEERRVGKGVDLGGRRIIKKKKKSTMVESGRSTRRFVSRAKRPGLTGFS